MDEMPNEIYAGENSECRYWYPHNRASGAVKYIRADICAKPHKQELCAKSDIEMSMEWLGHVSEHVAWEDEHENHSKAVDVIWGILERAKEKK